jgi:hypothetical protein
MTKRKYKLGDILSRTGGRENGRKDMESIQESNGPPCDSSPTSRNCEVLWEQVLDAINVQGGALKAQSETLAAQGEILRQQGQILRDCQKQLKNMRQLEAAYDFLKLEVSRNNGEVAEWARRCATRCETLHQLLEHHLNGDEKKELEERDGPDTTLKEVEAAELRKIQQDD